MTALLPARSSARALTKAQAEVDRLEQAVTRWQSDAAVKRAALADLEAGVGDAVLADETGTVARQLAVDATELRYGIDGAERAAEAARRQLQPARWAVSLAEAEQLRERAGKLRGEAQQRQQRVDQLLAELTAYEGGDWRDWEPTREDLMAAGTILMTPRRTPPMFAEAARLEQQAQQIEERVETEKRRAAPVVPHAQIDWRPGHSSKQCAATVSYGINDGVGGATFEVVHNGFVVDRIDLPGDGGRRGGQRVYDGLVTDVFEVRSGGHVLASTADASELP